MLPGRDIPIESKKGLYLSKQLNKLKTKYLDLYLLHSLGKDMFEIVKKFNLIQKMEEAKEKGLIKHIGFSFHDSLKVFKEIWNIPG